MHDQDKELLLSCPVINTDILAQLGAVLHPADVVYLKSLGAIKKFPKNATLVHSGEKMDQLVYLIKGLVRSATTGEDGTERTYGYFTPGCFIGDAAFFHRQPVLYDMRFMEQSEAVMIDRHQLPHIIRNPSIVQFMLVSVSLVSRTLAMRIEESSFRSKEEKVYRILLCLSGTEYIKYKPHFTHQEIADMAGVHRVTVTNTLQVLKKEGIIEVAERGRIRVTDLAKLYKKIND